ncbi:hypothetical protein REPUB_Repub20aG0080900 [Reevesia pubescens]
MGSGSEKIALIFNIGAGYCDAAVTATAGGVSQIKALAGSATGGDDLLQNMMHHLLPNSENLFSSHRINEIKSMGLLRVATQEAIHKLSFHDSVQIDVDLGNGSRICKVVNREEFEEKQQSGAALEGAVASGISDPFGSLDLLTIQATLLAIGIRANGNTFLPIIPRNTTMPARKKLIFTTVHDNQTEVLIVVYEGEAEKAEVNHLLGYFKIMGIPPAPKGVPEINVCMDIDASNVLRVLAGVILPGSQQPVVPVIEVRMPTVDDGHVWCAEALHGTYGSTLDFGIVLKCDHRFSRGVAVAGIADVT